jgi:hypothetical protein
VIRSKVVSSHHYDQWWVTQGGQQPIGPVSTELVVRGIAAGRVPLDSFVCEVGGTAWSPVRDVRHFAEAVAIAAALKVDERPSGRAASLPKFDGTDDRTLVDMEPLLPSEVPRPTERTAARTSARAPQLAPFDGSDDMRTVTDIESPISSEALSSDVNTERDVAVTIPRPKRKLEIVEELTLTDSEPFFPPD